MIPISSRLRLIRRLRTLRRRWIRTRLDRLAGALSSLWTEPPRRSVAWQLRRLANAVEASMGAAARIAAAEDRLSRDIERLVELSPRDRPDPPRYTPRPAVAPANVSVALMLGVTALALVVGNTWLLDRHLVAPVLAAGGSSYGLLPGLWLPVAFSTLALVLGLFHFALFTSGRSVWLRLLGALAIVLLVAQGALQAGATALAVLAWAGPTTGSWAGIGALVLIAGAAGLVPPVIGTTAHASIDRLSRWAAAREHRAAARSGYARERVTSRLEKSLHEVTQAMAALRSEAGGLAEDDVARLLVRPADGASVERLVMVLRRMAMGVERDPRGEPTPVGTLALRHLGDLSAFAVWLLAAGAALWIAAPAARAATAGGLSGLALVGTFGGLASLLVGGLVLRSLLDRPGRAPRPPVVTAAAILLLTVAASALAMGLGALAAAQPPFQDAPLGVAAILTLLLLTAGLASTRLPEGIRAIGNAARSAAGLVAWSALTLADLALATADLVLTGQRRAARRARGTPRRQRPRRPAVGAVGGGRNTH